jgi:multiple sugar transport system substrate-binding protein
MSPALLQESFAGGRFTSTQEERGVAIEDYGQTNGSNADRSSRADFLRRGAVAAAVIGGSAYLGPASLAATKSRARAAAARVDGTISVRFWGSGGERTAWFKRIDYFKSKYPNVTVKPQLLTKNGYDEFPALLTQIASGNPPDVLRVLNFQPTQLVEQGDALLQLDSLIAKSKGFDAADFTATARSGGKVGGKTYSIAQNGEPYVLFYNATAFKKAGLEDPWTQYKAGTWDQAAFAEAANALKAKGGVKYGAAFEAWNYDNFAFMGGGKVLSPAGKPMLSSGTTPKTLQTLADLVKSGVAPSAIVDSGTYFNIFSKGDLGMYISGCWWGKYMPKVSFGWKAAPLPSFSGHLGSKYELDSVAISKKSKNPEAAWAFVQAVTDKTGLSLWIPAATPTRSSVLKSKKFLADKLSVPAVLEMIDHSTFTPFTKAGAAVDTAAITALAPLWLGKQTAVQATKSADSGIATALK